MPLCGSLRFACGVTRANSNVRHSQPREYRLRFYGLIAENTQNLCRRTGTKGHASCQVVLHAGGLTSRAAPCRPSSGFRQMSVLGGALYFLLARQSAQWLGSLVGSGELSMRRSKLLIVPAYIAAVFSTASPDCSTQLARPHRHFRCGTFFRRSLVGFSGSPSSCVVTCTQQHQSQSWTEAMSGSSQDASSHLSSSRFLGRAFIFSPHGCVVSYADLCHHALRLTSPEASPRASQSGRWTATVVGWYRRAFVGPLWDSFAPAR
jgi:hypothetical protein